MESIAEKVWQSILSDLNAVNYRGWFAFHNYNEPLADPGILLKVHEAREALLEARLAIYTNGDFLDKKMLANLVSLGISEIRVNLYPAMRHEFDVVDTERISTFLDKLDVKIDIRDIRDGVRRIEARLKVFSTELHLVIPRISHYTDRGGAVTLQGLALTRPRTLPCYLPFLSASIDYHGNLKLCCQIYNTRRTENHAYVIGNLYKTGFLELWYSEKMNQYRELVSTAQFKNLPACLHCSHALSPEQETWLDEKEFE